jgi:hypothetical protein
MDKNHDFCTQKRKISVWCDDPPEDPVISIFAGCLTNHDRAHSRRWEGDTGQTRRGLLFKAYYQAFFWVLIDLIVELLGLIIKPFDNQTES